MTLYNKLIRDKIPQIIEQSGSTYAIATYSDADYLEALKQKLVEEAQEASLASSQDELVTELADLFEVIDALLETTGIERETVIQKQRLRREERGSFRDKIELLWIEKEDENPRASRD
jgi:predicted house-cleaning noncanonical NTP pyrophosphatase (MazG superfamily)